MTTSNEAVEAAAMAILCVGKEVWELQTPRVKDAARSDARAALEAATPNMLDDLASAYMAENADVNRIDGTPIATQEQWRFYHWLSLRAATLRHEMKPE